MMSRKESVAIANPVEGFKAAMSQAGIEPINLTIIPDGKIHRFKVEGDRGRERSGWYVLYGADLPAGAFGDWRKGINEKWCSKKESEFTPEERAAFRRRMEEARAERETEERVRHLEASKRAKAEWSGARPATPDHPYLVAKVVMPHSLKVDAEGQLLVPLYSADGKISTLEYISPNGDKKFMYGGRKRGCFYPFGILAVEGEKEIIILVEGFATGASVYEATGILVAAAMDGGNLKAVAEALHKIYPDYLLLVAADNDEHERGEKYAREAAQAVGGRVVVCPEPGDFNDLAMTKGLETVREVIIAGLESPRILIEHEDVELLPGVSVLNALFNGPPVTFNVPDLPQLKPSLLPSWLGNMVSAVSEATETPPELPALLGVGVVATCVQGKVIVRPSPGYLEPVSIYVAPTLDSGNRKTSVLNQMTRPLREWEREQAEALQPEIEKARSERKTIEARIGRLQKDAAKLDGEEFEKLMAKIVEIEAELPEVPKIPQLWTQDVTPERLGSLMAENGERIAILSDEGGIFETMAGRYSNGIPNLDLILQAHAGAPVRVDRGSRPSVFLYHPALTIVISPQTDVIRGLALKPGFRGRGLLARYFYALPNSPLGYRKLESKPIWQSVRDAYSQGIHALLDMPPAIDGEGRLVAHIFEYSEDAFREWHEFSLMVEREMREEGRFALITDWASKLPGGAARIAGLFHCVEFAGTSPIPKKISLQTIKRALEVAAILSEHALAAFGLMGADPAIEGAKKVWRWVERNRSKSFTARDCFQALKGSFLKMDELQPALDVLVERAYIAKESKKESTGRGRPPSTSYCVNPSLTEDWA
jgi:putative DNA primase/helicase